MEPTEGGRLLVARGRITFDELRTFSDPTRGELTSDPAWRSSIETCLAAPSA